MTYFVNADCLEPIEPMSAARSKEDLEREADGMRPSEILTITDDEYQVIKREIGLGWRWRGRRVFVTGRRR